MPMTEDEMKPFMDAIMALRDDVVAQVGMPEAQEGLRVLDWTLKF
jgi:hypothetical protein